MISKQLIREVRAMDRYDLRRLLMLVRGMLLEDPPAPGDPADDGPARDRPGKVTFRQEMVRCGKQGCTRCPHGPYWYAYWRQDGRTRSRYVGKTLPGQAES